MIATCPECNTVIPGPYTCHKEYVCPNKFCSATFSCVLDDDDPDDHCLLLEDRGHYQEHRAA